MNIISMYDKIYAMSFHNKYLMCSTLMRIQEYYESPVDHFRGNYFTHEDFMDDYAANNRWKFTYFSDWSGFNIPGNVVIEFFELFNDLNKKETDFRRSVEHIIETNGDQFYLIGTIRQDQETINHELAHAFYYLDSDYKKQMDIVTENWDHASNLYKKLIQLGYHDSVLLDETQAYIGTSTKRYLRKILNFRKPYPEEYKEIFNSKFIEQIK